MIYSMTAFARVDKKTPFGTLIWEIRSVNHRYLESYLRLAEDFRSLETAVREKLARRLNRGKVECTLQIRGNGESGETSLQLNRPLAEQLGQLCEEVAGVVPGAAKATVMDILRWPGVLESPGPDQEALNAAALELLDQALDELLTARGREGEKLQAALEEHRQVMSQVVVDVRQRLPEVLKLLRQRLLDRFQELDAQLDENRLEQEMIILMQRTDVEEEMKRLETHLEEVARILDNREGKPVGRRLDFLMQELNREANTLCSKSMDSETTKAGVELKVRIEQMREQVQNIE